MPSPVSACALEVTLNIRPHPPVANEHRLGVEGVELAGGEAHRPPRRQQRPSVTISSREDDIR